MALRFPLFLKKRGRRRTGARWLGPFGEALLYASFVLFGAVGLVLLYVTVLGPQWKVSSRLPRYEQTNCTVADVRVENRRAIHGTEYRPRVAVEYTVDGQRYGPIWTYDAIGTYDMTTDDVYFERGINLRHGYLTEYYVDDEEYVVKVPAGLKDVGVLLEPMTVVEKGIAQAYEIQRRLKVWRPRRAAVMGAGTIGLPLEAATTLRDAAEC